MPFRQADSGFAWSPNDLSSGDVAAWPNRGSDADAVQVSSTRRPTYHPPSTDFGGNASVGFNEGTDNDEALEIGGVSSHAEGTLIAVFRQEGTESHNYGIFGLYGSSGSRAGMVTRANSTGGPIDYWDSSNGWISGSTVVSAAQAYVGAWEVRGGGVASLSVDGAPAGSGDLPAAIPGFDRYVVGMSEPSTSSRFDGQIAELLFYDRVLAKCELDQIVADLGGRYGVSVTISGNGPCYPPADPTDLTATAVGYDGIDLAWTDASANEDGFRIERRPGQTGAWTQIAETGPDVTFYESRSLIQQTEYCYRVVAFNGDGTSAYTNTPARPRKPLHRAPASTPATMTICPTCTESPRSVRRPTRRGPPPRFRAARSSPWYFGIDSGVDSDHPDLNVVEALNFVASEPNRNGEDGNGHGTHTAGTAAARDGNGGVVGVAPGAPIYSFRVCEDGGSCQTADMVAAMDEVWPQAGESRSADGREHEHRRAGGRGHRPGNSEFGQRRDRLRGGRRERHPGGLHLPGGRAGRVTGANRGRSDRRERGKRRGRRTGRTACSRRPRTTARSPT